MSAHSSRGSEWNKTRTRVLERDGHKCVVCGNPATQVDHIIPKAVGGSDEMNNLQAMCQTHNAKKGSKTVVRGTYWDKQLFPNGLPTTTN